jgi:dGTPase
MRAGLFAVDDLKTMPLTAAMIAEIDARYPVLDQDRRGAELVRELISYLITAVFSEATKRLDAAQPGSVDDIRHHATQLIQFPAEAAEAEAGIKSFLKLHMYRHQRIMRIMGDAERIVSDLFAHYLENPSQMSSEWLEGSADDSEAARARRIGNFIAGMTDRYALIEHQRLFDSTPDLR